jgi:hypothetical protein
MALDLYRKLESADWAAAVKRLLSKESGERIDRVTIGFEPDKNGRHLFISRKHDGATIALPVDMDRIATRGVMVLGEDEMALLILFLG